MRILDLFSGIGGFALAAQNVFQDELEIVSFCEIDAFCQKVLAKHWPDVPCCNDIKTMNGSIYENIDILTGGFPCQPFSTSGRRKSKQDERYLWPQMLEVVKGCRPRWIIVENVVGIVNLALDEVCTSLEMENYEVWPVIIPACSLNAPHRRERVWVICHTNSMGLSGINWGRAGEKSENGYCNVTDPTSERQQRQRQQEQSFDTEKNKRRKTNWINDGNKFFKKWERSWIEVATKLCGMDDGLSAELDGYKLSKAKHRQSRIRSLGNAIVPQIAEVFFGAIKEIEQMAA